MAWHQPIHRRQWYRYAIIAVVLALIGTGALAVASQTADAQTELTLDELTVAGANQTVSGNVSDVRLSTTLDWQTDVPDGERRIIRLRAGPAADNLELIDYTQQQTSGEPTSGTVTLSGSLTDHPDLTTDTFAPPIAGNATTEVVVEAIIEVRRATGETVTHTVTDTATVRLRDDATLEATVGGSGTITVETSQ